MTKLVVIGAGMASGRVLEHLFDAAPGAFEVTLFNAEPRGNYNRIMLSPVLSGEKSRLLCANESRIPGIGLLLAKRRDQRLTERDAGILHRVMIVDMQIALGADLHVDQRVAGKMLQHVIEEAHARVAIIAALAVEVDLDRDLGLAGRPFDPCLAHLPTPLCPPVRHAFLTSPAPAFQEGAGVFGQVVKGP